MAVVMGTPFDRIECPTATLGIGPVKVTDPNPRSGYISARRVR